HEGAGRARALSRHHAADGGAGGAGAARRDRARQARAGADRGAGARQELPARPLRDGPSHERAARVVSRLLRRGGRGRRVPRAVPPCGGGRHRRRRAARGHDVPRDAGHARARPASATLNRLLDHLRVLFPDASRTAARGWLAAGRVRVDGVVVRRGDAEIPDGARVTLGAPAPRFPSALRLVHEDDDLIVVDKPAGLLTIGTERERERTAYRLLFDYVLPTHRRLASPSAAARTGPRLFIVHRLDRESSGLLVF